MQSFYILTRTFFTTKVFLTKTFQIFLLIAGFAFLHNNKDTLIKQSLNKHEVGVEPTKPMHKTAECRD